MSTSIVLFDNYSNANDVDIMVFEPCDSPPPPAAVWGGEQMTWSNERYEQKLQLNPLGKY